METSSLDSQIEELFQLYKNLEARLASLEKKLTGVENSESAESAMPSDLTLPAISSDTLEINIGQFWFAKAGIVVLAMGIIFLLTFPYQNLPAFLPALTGYILVGVLVLFTHLWRKSFNLISHYLLGSALILLYFTTLRLNFFSSQPLITDRTTEVVLLLAVVAVNLYVSLRRNSIYLTALSLTTAAATAVVSDQAWFIFALLTGLAAFFVYLRRKFVWHNLLIYGIFLVYLTHFVWFVHNPFMGHKLALVSAPSWNLLFLLLYFTVFSLGNLFRDRTAGEDNQLIVSTFLNSAGGFGLFLLISVTRFQAHMAIYHLLASLLFIGLAILFWVREKSRYSTFFYSMLGYTALSVAIIAHFSMPEFFIWLCWQSLVVISTAIWFRSKFIVLANFVIYLLIFLTYLVLAGRVGAVSLSFGAVALLSARIMNWQKHRLELQTEFMRNAYLAAAFFIFPYALYHTVPSGYLALSWMGVAVFYYLMSVILTNKKYRWLSLLTLLLTVGYVFIFGLARFEPVYRIISFIVLGLILLGISLIYTRKKTKSSAGSINKG